MRVQAARLSEEARVQQETQRWLTRLPMSCAPLRPKEPA